MKLVISEKPSVAQSIAVVIGAKQRGDGFLEGGSFQRLNVWGNFLSEVSQHFRQSLSQPQLAAHIARKGMTEPLQNLDYNQAYTLYLNT